MRRPWWLAVCVGLAGCHAVGPDFTPDRMRVPAAFAEHPATAAEVRATEREATTWWAAFGDPVLDGLVADAIGHNLELRAAAERIAALEAMRREARGALYPEVDATGEFAEQHFSSTLEYPPLPNISTFNKQYQLGPQVSWEIDLWGRVRREVEARGDERDAAIERRRGALVSLLAELVDQYVALRSAQARLRIREDDVRIAAASLQLAQRTFAQGLGTSLQVAQAEGELDAERATLAPLRTAASRAIHAIGVLTGAGAERHVYALSEPAPLPQPPPLPATLPSAVIAERPDIREAERRYAAAVARIGVAVAQMYPRFDVPLYALPESSELHTLFSLASFAWQAALSVTAPVYTGGRLRNATVAARAQAAEARLGYENTVLRAFGEVEDALSAYRDDRERLDALRRSETENRLALHRAQLLYAHGLSPFLDLLTAERAVSTADDARATGEAAVLGDTVALFRAIGAGWRGADRWGSR